MLNGYVFSEPKTRRRKVIRLSPEAVLSGVFGRGKDLPMALYIPHLDGIPTDAKVLDAAYSPMDRAFSFLLEHDSFEEVPDGMWAPAIDLHMENILMEKYVKEKDATEDQSAPQPDRAINFREFF